MHHESFSPLANPVNHSRVKASCTAVGEGDSRQGHALSMVHPDQLDGQSVCHLSDCDRDASAEKVGRTRVGLPSVLVQANAALQVRSRWLGLMKG